MPQPNTEHTLATFTIFRYRISYSYPLFCRLAYRLDIGTCTMGVWPWVLYRYHGPRRMAVQYIQLLHKEYCM